MIFISESGKEIQVPNDYTYMSMEKFAKEIYQQGRADAIDEFVKQIKESDRYKYFEENNVLKVLRFEEEIEQIAEQMKGAEE